MIHRRLAAAALTLLAACGGTAQAPAPSPSAPLSPATGAAAPDALPPGHPPMTGDLPAGHPPLGSGGPADPAQSVAGTVTLAPTVAEAAAGSGSLYVIARGKDGQIQAVQKIDAPSFPARFQLSAADAMQPGSAFEGPFDVTARLSKTGDAMPAPGDLEGTSTGLRLGTADARVVIDTIRK